MDKTKLLEKIFEDYYHIDHNQYVPYIDKALSALNDRDRQVLVKRLSGETLSSIGKHMQSALGEFSITQERVRQIEIKAAKRLREKLVMLKIIDTQTEDIYSVNIDELPLSVRASRALHSSGIKTISNLIQKSANDILRTKNTGRKTLREIEALLAEMGLTLLHPEKVSEEMHQIEVYSFDSAHESLRLLCPSGSAWVLLHKDFNKTTPFGLINENDFIKHFGIVKKKFLYAGWVALAFSNEY